MRNPHRLRAIGVAIVVTGIAALVPVFVLPKELGDSWVVGVGFVGGLMAIIFGSLWTSWRHREARAKDALLLGKDQIARWRVDPQTWAKFRELNQSFNINTVSVRKRVPKQGVEIVIGPSAIMVDDSVYTLNQAALSNGELVVWGGDWLVEQCSLHPGPPRCICLYAFMGNARNKRAYTNLIFPVAPGAEREADQAFQHFNRRAAAYVQLAAVATK